MEDKPNYYAIIPADVRYDNELRANEKLLYGEITALAKNTGECWANNKYFAELYNVKINAVSTWIKHLKEKQYIEINYEYNGKEIEKRIIKIGIIQKDTTSSQKDKGGIIQKDEDNNKSINNTSKENNKKKYFCNHDLNELFLEFLDLRTKIKCKNTDRAIKLLLNELNKYDDEIKTQMINNSIMNSWKSVYPIKEFKTNKKEDNFNKVLEEVYNGTIQFK